jgi:tRNA (guanine-N7-)-methyltransferase
MFCETPEELHTIRGERELWVELGCGMGTFAASTARENQNIFVAAIERISEAIVVAAERADGIQNIRFIRRDAAELEQWFAPGSIDRLFIQFCDPWHKKKQGKRRLTHRNFLSIYSKLLSPNGILVFKTDNVPLFEFTLEELEASGWEIPEISRDWHGDPLRAADEPMTEYESKFFAKGQPISRLVTHPRGVLVQ